MAGRSAQRLAGVAFAGCVYVMVPNAVVAVVLLAKRDVRGLYLAGLVALYAIAARRALKFADHHA